MHLSAPCRIFRRPKTRPTSKGFWLHAWVPSCGCPWTFKTFHSMIAEPPRNFQGQLGDFNLHETMIRYDNISNERWKGTSSSTTYLRRGSVSSPFGMDYPRELMKLVFTTKVSITTVIRWTSAWHLHVGILPFISGKGFLLSMSIGILCLDHSPPNHTGASSGFSEGGWDLPWKKTAWKQNLSKEANTSTHKALTRSGAYPNSNKFLSLLSYITDLEGPGCTLTKKSNLGDVYARFPSLMETSSGFNHLLRLLQKEIRETHHGQ